MMRVSVDLEDQGAKKQLEAEIRKKYSPYDSKERQRNRKIYISRFFPKYRGEVYSPNKIYCFVGNIPMRVRR